MLKKSRNGHNSSTMHNILTFFGKGFRNIFIFDFILLLWWIRLTRFWRNLLLLTFFGFLLFFFLSSTAFILIFIIFILEIGAWNFESLSLCFQFFEFLLVNNAFILINGPLNNSLSCFLIDFSPFTFRFFLFVPLLSYHFIKLLIVFFH